MDGDHRAHAHLVDQYFLKMKTGWNVIDIEETVHPRYVVEPASDVSGNLFAVLVVF
ncbi:hypothetical protein D3C85_1920600 [compost metagenome]